MGEGEGKLELVIKMRKKILKNEVQKKERKEELKSNSVCLVTGFSLLVKASLIQIPK